ncbi:MAG: ABC transporter ATP-binding protein [Lachnospiraceae bacterium]|nr:ABC transporter ATP-binding protein [Lachnospiraceae bacterium]
MIKLKNITKEYRGASYKTTALNQVTLDIKDGDFACVMGKSGSGKSTLLHIIGCMDMPSEGEYYLDDICVKDLSPYKLDRLRREKISFVFQGYELMSRYTVWENIELPLNAKRIRGKKKRTIIKDIMERLEITELKDKYPGQISGGEQQRVAIARAYVMDTPYIVADEPTGALDEANSDRILDLFESLHNEGKTIILVSHDMDVAQRGDYIINLQDGHIKEEK